MKRKRAVSLIWYVSDVAQEARLPDVPPPTVAHNPDHNGQKLPEPGESAGSLIATSAIGLVEFF